MAKFKFLTGAGGGGKGGGGGGEEDNTLRSNASVRLIDLLGEGEIVGLVDGAKSIYFDETPLQSSDGSYNFEGITWQFRAGLPDQSYVPGFGQVENEVVVGADVIKSLPITRSIVGDDLDAIRVTIRIPALTKRDDDDGELEKTTVQYRIEVRYDGGPWTNPSGDITIRGKCTSPYDRAHYIRLPKNPLGGSSPWEVRVTRITNDSDTIDLQNDTQFASYTRITDGKFTYPWSALIAMKASAQQFGQSVPERTYEVKGRIIQVPVNYEPTTREYTGLWNGTFKWAWSDNPAWVLYDILSDDRFGLGEYITPAQIDKWTLYEIAQYCDGMVPDGKGGEGPRFTFNAWLRTQKEAYDAVATIAAAFRGMTFWSSGSVMASQDRPKDVSILANPSNVLNGAFSYQSSAVKARHTVCVVKWNNPDHGYNTDFVVVEDQEGIARYGYREKVVEATGCTDRALAYRIGEWTLFTELNETQVVAYSAGLDHAGARPGDIVAIQDPEIAEVEFSGRLSTGSSTTVLNLDHPVQFTPGGGTYTILVSLPNGTVEEKEIVVGAYNVDTDQITLASALSATPSHETTWVIAATTLEPSLWQIVSLRENDQHLYEVSATQHEPSKFLHIDGSARFDPLPVRPESRVQPPTNLDVVETLSMFNGSARSSLLVSWTAPALSVAIGYDVYAETPNGRINYGRVPSTSLTIFDAPIGEYTFYVHTVGFNNRTSLAASVVFTSQGWQGSTQGSVANLRLYGKDPSVNTFEGSGAEFEWDNVYPASVLLPDGSNPVHQDNIVKIFDTATNDLLRTEYVKATRYSYDIAKNRQDNAEYAGRGPSRAFRIEVQVRDKFGRISAAVTKSVSNPVPAMITPTVTPSFSHFMVRWTNPTDNDYAGTLVWVGATPGFNPLTTPPFSDGTQSVLIVPANAGVTYYVRVAAYDTFGKVGLNISSEISVMALGTFDVEPPAVPTGLALTSALEAGNTGFAKLTANWNDNTETDLAYYDLQIKEGTGNWVSITGSESVWEGRVRPNIGFSARVRAVDTAGNKSNFSTIVTHTSAVDTVPPAVPTSPVATPGFGTIWLKWGVVTDPDLKHYEVYEHTASTPAPVLATVATYVSASPSMMVSGYADGTTRHFWIRAVDTSGNKSAWSTRVQATTTTVDAEVTSDDLIGLIDATSFAASIAIPGIGATLPATPFTATTPTTFYLTTDKKLYIRKADGSGWDVSTAAHLIDGQLTVGQIAAGAIGADQIAANAIRARHLLVGNAENLISNPQLQTGDFSDWWQHVNPANQAVVPRTTAGVPAGAPTVNVARFTPTTTDVSVFSHGVPHTSVTGGMAVKPNEKYRFQIDHAHANGATGIRRIYAYFRLVDGTFNSAQFLNLPISNSWQTSDFVVTVPANAYKLNLYIMAAGGGSGDFFWTDPKVIRMTGTILLEDGAVTSDKVTTGELITLSAQIKAATILDLHVTELNAAKLMADTAIARSITVDGRSLSSMAKTDVLFDDFTEDAELISGNGTVTYDTNAVVTGSRRVIVSSAIRLLGTKTKVPFDPAKLYRITFRVKRMSGTAGNMYLGLRAFDADGISVGTIWVAANGVVQSTVATATWTEYVGYIKGVAATIGAGVGTIAAPKPMIDTTRLIQPALYFNYNLSSGGSQMALDMIKVEVVTEEAGELVNAGTTQIDPGKITIQGVTTLADWKAGPDKTTINGGALEANTVLANAIVVGARGVTLENIEFEHNSPTTNKVTWTAGTVRYINDAGVVTSASIAGNIGTGVAWASGVLYIYWVKGATTLSTTTVASTAFGQNNIVLATYQGGVNLVSTFGRTIIDGSNIKTGTITATQINVTNIRAAILIADAIKSGMIEANTITTRELVISNPSNMVPNPSFSTGDLTNWRAWANPTGVEVFAHATYPGGYTCRLAPDATVDTSVFSHGTYTDDNIGIPVVPDEQYQIAATCNWGGTSTFRLYAYLKKTDGTYTTITHTIPTGSGWIRRKFNITIPADCKKMNLYFLRVSGGTGYAYFSDVSVTRRMDGLLIVDGAITADHITVTSLSAISANLGAITAGSINIGSGKFVVTSAGAVTILSATSGARLEIRSTYILMVDAT